MKIRLLLLTCVAALFSLCASAKNDAPCTGGETSKKNDVVGGVYNSDTKKPISNVSITAYLSSKKEKVVLTNNNGSYAFDELKAGTYKFVFEKEGYKKVVKDKVAIRPDEGFQLNIEMEEHAVFDFMPGPFHFSDFHD